MIRALLAALFAIVVAGGVDAADSAKVLRIAQFDIDTLDPQQYSDDPSFQVIQAIFEPAYEWEYGAKSPKLVPLTAAVPPQVSDDGKVWTVTLKRGIFFHDDPVFKGKPRELVAEDYLYAYRRWLDPNGRRAGSPVLTDLILGARPIVDAAKKGKFDYDAPIEGLKLIDRYTFQLRLKEPNYPNVRDLLGVVCAVPREVVADAKGDIRTRAVGTGAYRLKDWKRGSKLVLVANPKYRETYFDGRRVPMAGTIEVNFIDEDLTRLLLFEQGGLDFVQLRGEVATRLLSGDKLKPEYAARGITRHTLYEPFLFSVYFNVKDPTIGGMTNERVALRRAIAMGLDTDELIKVVLAGQAVPANQMIPPGVTGHDSALPVKSMYDPKTANALLDRFGYGKRDAEGFRTAPDGSRLALTLSLRTGGVSREVQTLWKKNMQAIGLRSDFALAPFQDVIKDLEKGKYQMYQGGFGGSPSGYNIFAQLHSVQPQRVNIAQFGNADYDRAAADFLRAANEEEEIAAARAMNQIDRTFMPQLPAYFRIESIYTQPWLAGYRPMVFSSYWKYLDIDTSKR
jgi:ABC-type transport system substrate-binding protein